VSGWLLDGDTVEVRLEECLCPGTPHPDGDTVQLRAELGLDGGLAVLAAMTQDTDAPVIERLGRAYLRHGVLSWTFVDERGTPVPVSAATIQRLRWSAGVLRLADRAAALYGEAVLVPLGIAGNGSSQSGQSDDATSPIPGTSQSRRTR